MHKEYTLNQQDLSEDVFLLAPKSLEGILANISRIQGQIQK